MTTEFTRKVANLNSDDNKMLLLNGRYYCQLTLDSKSLDVPEHYSFFSEAWKEENCPTMTQCTDCYVLDTDLEHGHHCGQFAKLYHSVHSDLGKDSFSLLLSQDSTAVSVTSIEIVDKPYQLKKFISLIGKDAMPPLYLVFGSGNGEPICSLDGVCFVDFGRYGSKSVSMEYDINGRLYFEIVDFGGVEDGEIVRLDDKVRREVLVNMPCDGGVLDDSNAKEIAALISARLRTLKKETEK